MKLKLIENARQFWRMWSIRLNAIGLAIMSYLWFDPMALLGVWQMMPPVVKSVLPLPTVNGVAAVLFVFAIISRVVHQPRMHARG